MDLSTVGRWYLPTRRRLDKLADFFASAIKTGISTPGVVLVQEDEFNELIDKYESLKLPKGWALHATKADGMGDKLKEMWADYTKRDWFGWLVDDLVCITPEWDKKLVAGLDGKNFVSAWDGGQVPSRMCVPVFSKALLNAVGYLYPPGFWHTYLDDVWEGLGRATGCWKMIPEVVLHHNHPFQNGQMVNPDETSLKSYSRNESDREAFERWKKYLMRDSIARIQALQRAGQ